MLRHCFGSIFRLPALPLVLLVSFLFVPSVTSANETDQDVPVSAVGGAVHADIFTGIATTSIPIYAPDGLVNELVEAYAGPHDFLNAPYSYDANGYQRRLSGFAYGFGEALSALNIAVATPIAAASVVGHSHTESMLLGK